MIFSEWNAAASNRRPFTYAISVTLFWVEVALLSLGEGLPAREVALVLETTEANVHTCLHLARKRIARAIGVDYARPDPT